MSDYDNPWKDALDRWFAEFVAFFFPAVHNRIDWTRRWQSLDAEFRQVVRDAELGKRLADKLVNVWLRDGSEATLLIHVEVQAWTQSDFARRMFVYHYRIFDRYNRQVVSLAVLADDRDDWRPNRFGYELGGCSMEFVFPIAKLLDYEAEREMLEASDNPFAIVTLAHLATRQTQHDAETRHAWKLRLVRRLYQRGLSRDDVLQLFNVIDWMMDLPPALEQLFKQEAEEIEREGHMPYVTSIERLARQEGKAEGNAEMLLRALQRHFKADVPEAIVTRIHATTDPVLLDHWLDLIYDTDNFDEFQQKMLS